ncbi:MAG: helix-turn-helix domain-containing protein [Maribacter sp.]
MKLTIDFILVTGIVVNLIILLVLFKTKKFQLHHKLFIGILGVLFLLLTTSYGIFNDIKWLQYLAIFVNGISYLLGPLIYLYVKSLATESEDFFKNNGKHFIPFTGYFLLITIPLVISIFYKEFIFSYLTLLNENAYIVDCIEIIFVLFYLVISLRLFYRIEASLKNVFSTLEYKNIKWIEVLAIGLILFSCIQFGIIILEKVNGESDTLDFTLAASYVSFVCYLGYYGLQQGHTIILLKPIESIAESPNNQGKRKYMSNEEIKEVDSKIASIFPSQKPYLDEELTLSKLASILETTDKKLSYYFNSYLQTSFYDFVNAHRIEAFKMKLANNAQENYSILGLAYDSGFKSKSSFNRIFKKETGLSPSAYLKTL